MAIDLAQGWTSVEKLYAKAPPTVAVTEEPWGQALTIDINGSNWRWCRQYPNGYSENCGQRAGVSTWHLGTGVCSRHTGNTRPGNVAGFLLRSFAFAEASAVTPLEALHNEVDYCAQGVAWLTTRGTEVITDPGHLDLMQSQQLSHLLKLCIVAVDVESTDGLVERVEAHNEEPLEELTQIIEALKLADRNSERARKKLATELKSVRRIEKAAWS